jgi:hypothetical protein
MPSRVLKHGGAHSRALGMKWAVLFKRRRVRLGYALITLLIVMHGRVRG